MPFVLRTTTTPPLATITATPQIVIIDLTGPAISVGPGIMAIAMVGEFLSGPFTPTEVTSGGQATAIFGGLSALLSQDAASPPVQNGAALGFNGNGMAAIKGKTFQRLVLQRVDTSMTTTDGGTTKSYVKFTVKVDPTDRANSAVTITGATNASPVVITTATQHGRTTGDTVVVAGVGGNTGANGTFPVIVLTPTTLSLTGAVGNSAYTSGGTMTATNLTKDLLIPAGTRFADAAIGSATGIVALSQNVTIPKGTPTALSTSDLVVVVDPTTLVQPNGADLTYNPNSTLAKLGATAFFVKGTTVGSGLLTTPLDPALPNVASTLRAVSGDIAGETIAAAATAIFAAGTASATLAVKIESLYAAAIDKLKPNDSPQNQIKAMFSARRSQVIRDYIVQAAIDDSSATPQGRVAIVSVDPATDTTASGAAAALLASEALASTESIQQDRCIISWPATTAVYSTELGMNIYVNSDGWMASILSNFPNEKNPGADPSPLLDAIVAMEPAYVVNPLAKQDYINLQAAGISALQKDPTVGWWYVNGVTAVNPTVSPTRVPIKRRMMADEIQAGLAQIAAPFLKQPATTERVDSFTGEMEAYLDSLLSPNNPSLQRIAGWSVDAKSGNTPDLTALGIFVFIIAVRLLASMDDIVLQTQIGETVTIVQQAA